MVEIVEATPEDETLPESVETGQETAAVEGQAADEAQAEQAGEEALVVTIGDEAPPEEDDRAAPTWIKDLRKQNRDLVRKTRELETRLQQAQPAPQAVVVGARPKLSDFDFDEDKFTAELDAWMARKAKADEQQREAQRAQEQQAADWQKRVNGYRAQAAALRVENFEAAEEVVKDTLSNVQQSLILKACKQPALMVAALGHNERKAREMAAITDPVEFVAEVARLETQLKTQSRKPLTAPEGKPPRSSMSGVAAVDSELAKLEARAAKTGDRTAVVQYHRNKARQAA